MKMPHTANCFFLSAFIRVHLRPIAFPNGAPGENPLEKMHDQTHLMFPLYFMPVCKESRHSQRPRSALILRNFENTKISIEPTLAFPYAGDARRCPGALAGPKLKMANPRNLGRGKLVHLLASAPFSHCIGSGTRHAFAVDPAVPPPGR
jgi:hypothetical protein